MSTKHVNYHIVFTWTNVIWKAGNMFFCCPPCTFSNGSQVSYSLSTLLLVLYIECSSMKSKVLSACLEIYKVFQIEWLLSIISAFPVGNQISHFLMLQCLTLQLQQCYVKTLHCGQKKNQEKHVFSYNAEERTLFLDSTSLILPDFSFKIVF